MTRREGEREEEGRCAGWVWKAGLAAGVGRSLIKEGVKRGVIEGCKKKPCRSPSRPQNGFRGPRNLPSRARWHLCCRSSRTSARPLSVGLSVRGWVQKGGCDQNALWGGTYN